MTSFKKLLCTAAVAYTALFSTEALAVTSAVQNVKVKIVNPLTIGDVQSMDFGVINKPAGSDETVVIDPTQTDGSNTGSSTATVVQAKRGQHTISGDAGYNFHVSAASAGSISGITFTDLALHSTLKGSGCSGAGGCNIPAIGMVAGGDTVYVGGTITVTNSVAAGDYPTSLTYQLTADYE